MKLIGSDTYFGIKWIQKDRIFSIRNIHQGGVLGKYGLFWTFKSILHYNCFFFLFYVIETGSDDCGFCGYNNLQALKI